MKINNLPLVFTVLALRIASVSNAQTGSCIQQITFDNERPIDTSAYIKPYSQVKQQEIDFKDRVKCGNGSQYTVGTPTEIISVKELVARFYDEVNTKMLSVRECDNKKCLSAIKIVYGLTPANSIQVLYEPLYLVQKYPNVDFIYEPAEYDNNVYRYNSTLKKFVSANTTAIDNYRNKIYIRKSQGTGGTFAKFGADDANSIIFSFQEIIKFYYKINRDEIANGTPCKDLSVHNGAEFYQDNRRPPSFEAKHSIFITEYDWARALKEKNEGALKVLTTSGDGANLAHLCPPSCTSLAYKLQ